MPDVRLTLRLIRHAGEWGRLSGRRVAHLVVRPSGVSRCGLTAGPLSTPGGLDTVLCNQCLMAELSGGWGAYKFFVGFVPAAVKAKRRAAWRAFLAEVRSNGHQV